MYFDKHIKYVTTDVTDVGADTSYVVTDTVPGFNNVFDFGFSSSLSTKLYGQKQFGEKSPLKAIRHVITPSVSFSYTPDFSTANWGYYDSYIDPLTEEEEILPSSSFEITCNT